MERTAWQMTVEHLGSGAIENDLLRFRAACARYLHTHAGSSEQEATDYVWNDGDCWERVARLTPGWTIEA